MATLYSQPPANVVFMSPQPHNQGTLLPGQQITLKQYTVTVERYLSQGGFAHVYLVRSAIPINGTTAHVLKRIAVADDIMLKEVHKEVDVMKVLRGHPNIVNLIDSSSYAHSNGTYEVFILMEYCAGGGIIDMMNRRLRERLTEAEILQIFVDVCEGVACMHNLKPALLHRDLKVENILQASHNSFKLCDFGSAATAALKPPSTTAEIRALEHDLNRHTTLQYRAPEMVDPYLRLPIDERSDVWALGVLLYKLCYYTTPFEEHGPLAILNVHYKIPSYPVYSAGMVNLITSMLQKYGTARPSVFELLDTVHRMRGTRSLYSYNPTPSIPSLPFSSASSPHPQTFHTNASPGLKAGSANTNTYSLGPPNPSSYPGHVPQSYPTTKQAPSPSADRHGRSTAAAARQYVLAAIQPMRRGRPTTTAPPISPGTSQRTENDVYATPTDSPASTPDIIDEERHHPAKIAEHPPPGDAPTVLREHPRRYGHQRGNLSGVTLQSGQLVEPQPRHLPDSTRRQEKPVATEKGAYLKATDSAFKVDDPSTSPDVHPGTHGRATTPATSDGQSRTVQEVLGAWELRKGDEIGGGTTEAGFGGKTKVSGEATTAVAAFDGFADSFDFGNDVGEDGRRLLLPMKATTGTLSPPVYNLGNNATFGSTSSRMSTLRSGAKAGDAFEGLVGLGFGGAGQQPSHRGTTTGSSSSRNTPVNSTAQGTQKGTTTTLSPSPALQVQSRGNTPAAATGTAGGRSPATPITEELSAEERFPSIEDYERRSPAIPLGMQPLQPPSSNSDWRKNATPSPMLGVPQAPYHRPALTPQPSSPSAARLGGPGSSSAAVTYIPPGARSQHTTGTAMKDAEAMRGSHIRGSGFSTYGTDSARDSLGVDSSPQTKYLVRRASLNVPPRRTPSISGGSMRGGDQPALPPRPSATKKTESGHVLPVRKPSAPPKDWLTGDEATSGTAVNTVSLSSSVPASTSANTPTTGATGLQRRPSANFMRRASAYGEVQISYTGQQRSKSGTATPQVASNSGAAVRPTKDLSESSADEGPEDATGTRKIVGSRVAPSSGTATTPTPTTGTIRAPRSPKKAGSVYDLVDVGSKPVSPTKREPSRERVFGRRQMSVHDLVDVTTPPSIGAMPTEDVTGRPRAESPVPFTSKTGPTSSHLRFPSTSHGATPPTAGTTTTPTRRPQSLFISSPSTLAVPKAPDLEPTLAPESPRTPDSPRKSAQPLRTRRGSIVDLVSKYEAMDAAAGARAAAAGTTVKSSAPPPPVASKPPTLQAPALGRSSSLLRRRPSLDMSPSTAGTSVFSGRSSHTKTRTTTEGPSAIEGLSVKSSAEVEQPRPHTPRTPSPTKPLLSPLAASGGRPVTPPPHSPSPERPYQGVASLIDQWQARAGAGPAKRSFK